MRIIEEEALPQRQKTEQTQPTTKQETSSNQKSRKKDTEDELEELDSDIKKAKHKQLKSYDQHSCAKLFSCFLLMLAIVFAAVGYLVIFVAGPIVKKVDELPKDFPKSLVLYQVDKAKIKVQNPIDKEKTAQLIRALPAWALNPFISYLSTEMKTQILAGNRNLTTSTANINLDDLEKALDSKTKTVSLSWNDLNKTKEDLFDYYKNQLEISGFEVKENISDYEIDLSFLREGISGAMTIADSFTNDNNSLVKMTVNYLAGK